MGSSKRKSMKNINGPLMLMSFHFSPLKWCRAILEGNKLNVKLIAKIITCFLQEFLCFCCFTGYDNVNLHFFLTNNRTLNSLEGGRYFSWFSFLLLKEAVVSYRATAGGALFYYFSNCFSGKGSPSVHTLHHPREVWYIWFT